ncbi:hypothetical protein [Allorhizocola rhizosphaerae]|uniref:hypothetical protein n=1 Tax=Allorhizocola rhizosphaerae TaxID=1872709 RepID=UPI0013C2E8C9|nr:hypothetical protein [Allorhizocola rhizosphaerae]
MATEKEIAAAGDKLFEMFGACGEAPDDVEVGRQADAALQRLEDLLRDNREKTRR